MKCNVIGFAFAHHHLLFDWLGSSHVVPSAVRDTHTHAQVHKHTKHTKHTQRGQWPAVIQRRPSSRLEPYICIWIYEPVFHDIFYIKLYVRIMFVRYLCLKSVLPRLQAVGSRHPFSSQTVDPGSHAFDRLARVCV